MEFEINKERWAIIEVDNDRINEIENHTLRKGNRVYEIIPIF